MSGYVINLIIFANDAIYNVQFWRKLLYFGF